MKRLTDKPEKLVIAALALAAFVAIGVYAAGAGAPKTVAVAGAQTCDRDLWDCSAWSACDAGYHRRDCVLSYDCPGARTEKPAERESCSVDTACADGEWRCDDWQACATDGQQYRECRHVSECNGASARPATSRDCPMPQCDQPTLRERVACRLGLTDAGRSRENELFGTPELCASMDADVRESCAALEASLAPCQTSPSAESRLSCARTVIGVSSDVAAEGEVCDELAKDERASCRDALRTKVGQLVLFRMLDLELRAQAARERGASIGDVADLIAAVEQARAAFSAATDEAGRVQAVQSARDAWTAFAKAAGKAAR